MAASVRVRPFEPIQMKLKKLPETAKASLFYGVALLLVLAVDLMPGTSTEAAMLTPLAAVPIVLLVVTRDGYTGKA